MKGKLFLLLSGVFLGLFLTEGALRVLHYPYIGCSNLEKPREQTLGEFDPSTGWRYTSSKMTVINNIEYAITSEGYRSGSNADMTDFSKPIILVVGDSVLFGDSLPFNETFGYKLKQRLDNRYEVINFAVQGYGTDQAFEQLKRVFPIYKPKIVILDYMDDHKNRNINQDRRFFFPCTTFPGTKPVFSYNAKGLVTLRYRPVSVSVYDSIRIFLVVRRFMEILRQKDTNYKELLSTRLLEAVRQYVTSAGSQFFLLDFNMPQEYFQTLPNVLGASTTDLQIQGDYIRADGHPNEAGTTKMVDDFLKQYPALQISL